MDERSWHIVHADCGPILLGAWYRRPCKNNEVESIRRFDQELQRLSQDCVASIIVGDTNVHDQEWLRWSNRTAPEGLELEAVCCTHGLKQYVKGPTRGAYLLDLVLSSLESGLVCKFTPGINSEDHECVLATVKLSVPTAEPVQRKVHEFKNADWTALMEKLGSINWAEFFDTLGADEAAQRFIALVLDAVEACVPSRWITEKIYAHPWLNEACREALERKHASVGSPEFPAARDACTSVFRDAHKAYVGKVREDLKKLAPSSRGWWKLGGSLFTKATGRENIIP